MTTVSSTTNGTTTTGSSLQTSSNGTLQITGLASGLNTDAIVNELMQIKEQPVNALQNQVVGLTAQDARLTSIQTALQSVQADVLNLEDPTLFHTTQAVSSNDPTAVAATATGSEGAGVGGYEVSVTQLATSAQRTFAYTSPSSADTFTIDGNSITVPAGESIAAFVNQINDDSTATVYAAATSSGTVVFSDRTTGDTGASFIDVQDAGGTLVENPAKAKPGQNAEYTVDGTSGSSSSNTITDAIAGVTLTLNAPTTTAATVTIGAPAPDASTIESAIGQFVSDYNSAITTIQTQLSTAPSSSDPTVGTLYRDPDLQGMLSSLRSLMYQSGSGLPTGLASMLDLGVSTGATTGTGSISSSSLAGDLVFNASTLQSQLTANPSGVQQVLVDWANSIGNELGNEAGIGGDLSNRISENAASESSLDSRISDMQQSLAQEQATLTQQYAALEQALSQNQSLTSWLTSQITALPRSLMTTYAANPTHAYRSSSVLTATGPQLVVMLHDGARRFLHQAAVAMSDRQIPLAHNKLVRAEDILRHLRATLDMTQGLISERLHGIYTFCLAHLARARLQQSSDMLGEVSTLLAGLRDSWATIAGD